MITLKYKISDIFTCTVGFFEGYVKGITAEHRALVQWIYRVVFSAAVFAVVFVASSFIPGLLDFPKNAGIIASAAQTADFKAYHPQDESRNPVITLELETNSGWCGKNQIYISVEDDLPVEYRYLCVETGEDSGWVSESSKSVNENGNWIVQVKDIAGNVTEETVMINNIDTQAPVIRSITEKREEGESVSNEE